MVLEMEEIGSRWRVEDNSRGSSNENRFPPNPLAGTYRNRFGAQRIASSCCLSTLGTLESALFDVSEESCIDDSEINFVPVLRSGGWSDIGFRCNMEDAHVCYDDLFQNCGVSRSGVAGPIAFYGVFDGHGGKHAAIFASSNLPKFISQKEDFPVDVEKTVASAFLKTDIAFAEACSLDSSLHSGTTALAALVIGRSLVVANTGDCRAVLSRKGAAIEMSRDHKPDCCNELNRIKASGGFIDDGGYLNGHLNVTRAIGDWHMEGLKDANGKGPLIADPELKSVKLTEDDEFLIIGCDGIWDVFRSQNAVDIARRKLQEHNDPIACCKELVEEALRRQSSDNLSVVMVCFQSKPPPSLSRPRPPPVRKSISLEGLNVLKSFLNDSSLL